MSSRQGVFTKHLRYYIDQAGSAARDKYATFLTVQSAGVYHYATNGSTNVSCKNYHAPHATK